MTHLLPGVGIVEGSEPPRTYDLNSWQETSQSRAALKDVPAGEPLFEGYGERPTFRKHIGSLGAQGDVVKLDGIGGSVILARGDLFRRGLNFPVAVFEHAVETEGLAKLALAMGVQPFGLPNVHVSHK